MGYPGDLTEEENEKLKYPFSTHENYDGFTQTTEGITILMRNSKQEISLVEQRTIAQIIEKAAEKTAENRYTQ